MTTSPYLIGFGVASIALLFAGMTGFGVMFGILAVALGTPLGKGIRGR